MAFITVETISNAIHFRQPVTNHLKISILNSEIEGEYSPFAYSTRFRAPHTHAHCQHNRN